MMGKPRTLTRTLARLHAAAGSLLFALVAAGGAAAQGLADAPQASPSGARTLEPRPLWVSSASWSLDGASLLVVDALESQVMSYPVAGGGGEAVRITADGEPAVSRPSILHPAGNSYLLEEEDALIVRLDRDFRVTGAYDLLKQGAGEQGRITGLYYWVPLGADSILGFAELQIGAGKEARHVSGFVRVPLLRPADFEILATVAHDAPARDYYRVGYSYLTSLGGRGYYLLMDSEPKLFAVDGTGTTSPRLLAAVPSELRQRPELPSPRGPGGVKEFFNVLQSAQIPTGLYGWQERLYLLARVESRWVLTRLDPENGRAAGSVSLPARSPHLLVVPGDPEWALIEKGMVKSLGDQRIDTVRLVADGTLRSLP